MLDAARRLHSYLRDLIDVTSIPFFDEATFQVLLDLGRELSSELRRADRSAAGLGENLAQQLNLFNQAWSLSTGQSMEKLWKLFKPQTAANLEQLDTMIKFEELADRFDDLAWKSRASVDTLAKLRGSVTQAYANIGVSPGTDLSSLKVSSTLLEGIIRVQLTVS